MIKIAHLKEMVNVKKLPNEVYEIIKGILAILDNEYGQDRDINDDGGYVLIVENREDFKLIKDNLYLDLEEHEIPEFVAPIRCKNGRLYTNSLMLCNNDYGISLIIPMELTPQNLKDYMVD